MVEWSNTLYQLYTKIASFLALQDLCQHHARGCNVLRFRMRDAINAEMQSKQDKRFSTAFGENEEPVPQAAQVAEVEIIELDG